MKSCEVTRVIAASAERVWGPLTNVEVLASPVFGIVKIEGQIAAGERIKLWSEVSPGRAFPLTVAVLERPNRMEWHGGMPFGLFRGVRRFTLSEQGGDTTFHMRETFTGPLSGLLTRSMPDLGPSFEKFGDALKQQAEDN